MLLPRVVVEPLDLAPDGLRMGGGPRVEHRGSACVVFEEPRFAPHHVLLGRTEFVAVHPEGGREPLAEARLVNDSFSPRLVPPEENKARRGASDTRSAQLVDRPSSSCRGCLHLRMFSHRCNERTPDSPTDSIAAGR